MDKKKICDIAVDITKSGVITGIKTLAEKSFVCSWIKIWYEEYGQVSGERRTTLVENEFTSKFLKLENELGKEKILNTPNLASLFTTTYQSAMTDVSEDKVSFYANTLVNAIRNENIDDVKTHIFLNVLRDFTKLHIEVLKFFSHSNHRSTSFQNHVGIRMRNTYDIIVELNKNLDKGEDVLNTVIQDLKIKSMIQVGNIDDIPMFFGIQKLTTSVGDEFLAFITEQEAKNV